MQRSVFSALLVLAIVIGFAFAQVQVPSDLCLFPAGHTVSSAAAAETACRRFNEGSERIMTSTCPYMDEACDLNIHRAMCYFRCPSTLPIVPEAVCNQIAVDCIGRLTNPGCAAVAEQLSELQRACGTYSVAITVDFDAVARLYTGMGSPSGAESTSGAISSGAAPSGAAPSSGAAESTSAAITSEAASSSDAATRSPTTNPAEPPASGAQTVASCAFVAAVVAILFA